MKKIIGITGGVGTGKSTISQIIKDLYNAVLITTDEVAHEVYVPGTRTYDQLVTHFGDGIINEDGSVVHRALADIIFKDKNEKKFVDNLIHPYVFGRIEEEINKWKKTEEDIPLLIETALMFETGCDKYCDEVWGVITDHDIRVKRLMEDRGYTKEKTESILSNQMSDDELREKCDKILINNGTVEELLPTIRSAHCN